MAILTADAAARATQPRNRATPPKPGNPMPPANGYPGRDIRVVNPGVDPATIARMYQQRIPTGPTAPAPTVKLPSGTPRVPTTRIVGDSRVGPGGATIQDVARVAGVIPAPVASAPETSTTPTAKTFQPPPPKLDEREVLARMIGGPSPTYGEKYGGMPSASYFSDLVRGEAFNILAAQQMAQEEATRLAAPIQERYERDIDPTKALGLAGRNLRGAEKILGTGTPTRIGQQTVNTGALQALASQMAGGRAPTANDYYAANMARMNAVRGTGDFPLIPDQETGTVRPTTLAEQVAANAAESARLVAAPQRDRDLNLFGATAAQELADAMAVMSPSGLMQQIAIDRYGVDPALAAGLFPASEDMAYQELMKDALNAQLMQDYGVDVTETVAETILREYGVEGLRQYQAQQAEYAMNGTPTQQLSAEKNQQDAENALFDEEARVTFGVDPAKVNGIDPEFMRDLLSDVDFTTVLAQARNAIVDGTDPLEAASEYSDQYARDTGDMLGARALGEILASFDLQSFQ